MLLSSLYKEELSVNTHRGDKRVANIHKYAKQIYSNDALQILLAVGVQNSFVFQVDCMYT